MNRSIVAACVLALARITATLTAAREALERLVVRLYPAPVAA